MDAHALASTPVTVSWGIHVRTARSPQIDCLHGLEPCPFPGDYLRRISAYSRDSFRMRRKLGTGGRRYAYAVRDDHVTVSDADADRESGMQDGWRYPDPNGESQPKFKPEPEPEQRQCEGISEGLSICHRHVPERYANFPERGLRLHGE